MSANHPLELAATEADEEEVAVEEEAAEEFNPLDHLIESGRSKRRLTEVPRLFGRAIRLVWLSSRRYFLLGAIATTLGALLAVGQVYAVRYVLKDFIAAQNGSQSIWTAMPWLIVLAAVTGLSMLLLALNGLMQRQLAVRVLRSVTRRIFDITTKVPLDAYETPDFSNQLQRVQSLAASRPLELVNYLVGVGSGLLGVAGMAATLLTLAPAILPILLVAAVPLWVAGRLGGRMEFEFAIDQAPLVRQRMYVEAVLMAREAAKEVRAFELGSPLRNRWERTWAKYLSGLERLTRRRTGLELVSIGVASLLGFGAVIVLLELIANHQISVADASTAALAIRVLSSRAQSLTGGVGGLFESRLFLQDLEAFLGRPVDAPQSDEDDTEEPMEIRVEDVHFTYPASRRPSLSGVNVRVAQNEVIALVGANGSGKTTLAKILAGLHEPSSGQVLWNSATATAADAAARRRHIAVVFQDYVRYQLTALDNISLGRPEKEPTLEAVRSAAEEADIDGLLASLPRGYSNILSKVFEGGTDLSSGQWQRVALARAFYRDAPLLILDEPSSALDPLAEEKLFDRVRQLMAGRSVVLISHRFATVRGADRIYVLDEGRILEEGSHDELMRQNGRYAEMYRAQRRALLGEDADPDDGVSSRRSRRSPRVAGVRAR